MGLAAFNRVRKQAEEGQMTEAQKEEGRKGQVDRLAQLRAEFEEVYVQNNALEEEQPDKPKRTRTKKE